MSRPSFLMCPPRDEKVFEMNPWKTVRRHWNHGRALQQWTRLRDLLKKELDCTIELLTPVEGLGGMVFTASGGFVRKRTFLRSNFRSSKFSGEEIFFEKWFKKRGFIVKTIEKPLPFEGEADLVSINGELYSGYHFPADVESYEEIAKILKTSILSLELSDKRFPRFETCFAPLDDQTALVFPGGLDPYARLALAESIPDLIEVPEAEALRFACAVVVAGRDVVIQAGCPETARRIEKRGFRIHEIDCSEFMKAGGAAKSLVLRLS